MSFAILPVPSPACERDIHCAVVRPTAAANGVAYFFHGISRLPDAPESVAQIYADRDGLQELADRHGCAIVAPFFGRRFGIDSEIEPLNRYETFLTKELPDAVEPDLGGPFDRTRRWLAGFSMGGYTAVHTLCRAPDLFAIAAVRGAVVDLEHGIRDLHWDSAGPVEETFGPYWENLRRYHVNSPFTLVNRLARRSDVAIGLEVGQDDFLLVTNQRFHAHLKQVGILHAYGEYPGGHGCGTREVGMMLTLAEVLRFELAARAATNASVTPAA